MKIIRIIVTGLILLSGFIMGAQASTPQQAEDNMVPVERKGSPVILSDDTIFHMYAPFGAFSADERARAISNRLQNIVYESLFDPDSLRSAAVDHEYHIYYGDQIIVVIGNKDTIGSGISMEAFTGQIVDVLKEHLEVKSRSFNFWFVFKNIAYTLLVVLLLGMIITLLSWLFRKIFSYLDVKKEKIFKSIVLNNYEFLNAEREYKVAVSLLKAIKTALIILLFLIALPVIFSIFPATEGVTRKIISLIWSPVRSILLGVVNYLPDLITIIVIYVVFRYLVRFVRFLSNETERKALVLPGFHPEWSRPTYNIIRVFLYAFMFVVIFPYLPGSDSPVFRGVSVFLGILLSLGSSTMISNAMAGMVITYMRPYKIGDRIKIDDVVGDVVEKTLMITRIRTIKNEDVTIPNAKILTGYTVNYSTPTEREGLIIHTTITIGYDEPWRTVHDLMIKAAEKTEGVATSMKPFVLQTSLDDFYISYQINAYIKDAQKTLQIKSDLHQNIQDAFNSAGLEIMSPHFRAQRDGNALAMPSAVTGRPGDK